MSTIRTQVPLRRLREELIADPKAALDRLSVQPPGVYPFSEEPDFAAFVTDPEIVGLILTNRVLRCRKSPKVLRYRYAIGDGTATSSFPPDGDTFYGSWSSLDKLRTAKRKVLADHLAEKVQASCLAASRRIAMARCQSWEDAGTLDIYAEMTELFCEVMIRTLFQREMRPEYARACREMRVTAHDVYLALRSPNPDRAVFDREATAPRCPIHHRNLDDGSALSQRQDAIHSAVEGLRKSSVDPISDPVAQLSRTVATQSGEIDQIQSTLVGLFSAGYENLASVAAWTLWHLAANPEWQTRVQEEACEARREFDDLTCAEEFPLLTACIREAMRICPPVWSTARELERSASLRDIQLPSGAVLLISPWVQHRSASLWDRPMEYDPGRFLLSDPPPGTYLPFGLGERSCVGQHVAMLELRVVLGTLLRHFTFSLAAQDAPPLPLFSITQRPYGGVLLCPLPRN